MHLVTHYAPGTFLRPVLIVDTVFNAKTRETALRFVEALNVHHAADLVWGNSRVRSAAMKDSGWIVVQTHATRDDAIAWHLDTTKDFINGGSEEELARGWEPYLTLYKAHCPESMKVA